MNNLFDKSMYHHLDKVSEKFWVDPSVMRKEYHTDSNFRDSFDTSVLNNLWVDDKAVRIVADRFKQKSRDRRKAIFLNFMKERLAN